MACFLFCLILSKKTLGVFSSPVHPEVVQIVHDPEEADCTDPAKHCRKYGTD
jgi:hypothetical protein